MRQGKSSFGNHYFLGSNVTMGKLPGDDAFTDFLSKNLNK